MPRKKLRLRVMGVGIWWLSYCFWGLGDWSLVIGSKCWVFVFEDLGVGSLGVSIY